VPIQFDLTGNGTDRTAGRVPKDDDKRCMQVENSIFDTAQSMVPDNVTRYPNHKNISDALVKNINRRHPGIRTGQNSGDWLLLLSNALPAFLTMIWMQQIPRHKPPVSLQKLIQRFIGRGALSGRFTHKSISFDKK
jgi:hypothetical protein